MSELEKSFSRWLEKKRLKYKLEYQKYAFDDDGLYDPDGYDDRKSAGNSGSLVGRNDTAP